MSGSTSTLRPAGLPSGYPAEPDASVKIRWVDNLLVNMSDRATPLLKLLGGTSQFTFNNPKVEWVEDDLWDMRLSHGGLASATATALTVTGASHRYPIGTIICDTGTGELMRVTAQADANTLTVVRDIVGGVTEATVASTAELIVAGQAQSEDEEWKFRTSAISTLPYNFAQVSHEGIRVTYRRNSTALYGLRGTDLDKISADMVAEMFVKFEGALLFGYRYLGSATTNPALMGGLRFYVTAANGAQVTDEGSAALTRKMIDDELQDLWYAVGPQNMATTILCSGWAKRKISSFFTSAERLTAKATSGGVVISSFETEFGTVNVMAHKHLAKDELYIINPDLVKMGHYEGLGRPHLLQLPNPSANGPRIERAFYADLSAMVKGVQSMARLHTFSTSS